MLSILSILSIDFIVFIDQFYQSIFQFIDLHNIELYAFYSCKYCVHL